MTVPYDPSIKLISGDAHRILAEDLARELGVPLEPAEIAAFADGESRVLLASDLRGADVYILQPTSPPVNDRLMNLALLIDAARAAGAARVTALVPYFGYARQEQRGRAGEPRSAQVAARLLASVGLDRLATLDLHAPALESAFPMPATLLGCEELFLPAVKSWGVEDLAVVSPDAGGMKRAQRFAGKLNAGLAVVAKDRPRPDQAAALQVLGDVRNRACLIVDDMASTGRTMAAAAEALRRAGAREVHAIFTHAVMSAEALQRLLDAPLGRIVTSDSIPVAPHPRLQIVRTAPLLAKTVRYLRGEMPAAPQT
ncbi:MAG TPA: ribose-phosphate pyrophosphokinase [Pirellulales bacterium]|nr:ribose-phosphate pyrophosphokinase [Pirellulales bacterium]